MARLRNFIITAGLAAIPILSAAVFASLAIYSGNVAEFSVAWTALLSLYLPYVLFAMLILGLPGALLGESGRKQYWSLLAALGVLTWLQGNILVWNYGALDGNTIDWTDDAWRGALDITIWVVVIAVAIRQYARFGRTLVSAAVAVFAIQVVGALVTLVSGPDEIHTRDSIFAASQGDTAVFEFSKQANVVHIVMDGFQTDIFQDILNSEHGASLLDDLQGFTLFEQNLGAYPYTQLTIPALLTGKIYRNEVPMADFVTSAIEGETILSVAAAAGFDIDIAAPVGQANVYGKADHKNIYGITPGSHVADGDAELIESAKLADLALFRVVPHFAKALVHRDELWVFQARVRDEEYLHIQYFSDVAFLQNMADNLSVGRAEPVYKMIHVMLAHKPTVGNASCEYVGRQVTTRESVGEHATCGLLRVAAILRRMKEAGVYDNSLIVLMADHGAWVPIEGLQNPDRGTAGINALSVAMASPLLAIKPPGSSGDLQVSNAATSIVDVPTTIADLLELDVQFPGAAAFGLQPGEQRDRFHAVYAYGPNPDAPGYLYPMQEFRVTGDSDDASSWHLSGRHLPGGQDSHTD